MRTLAFAGHEWMVKSSSGARVGPGHNVFTDAEEAVWVDARGALHLTIRRRGLTWECTEVVASMAPGHGRYRFEMENSPVFDPNVVAGMFLYRDDRHEIDIELSRFGRGDSARNAQFVVQPSDRRPEGWTHRFALEPGADGPTHEIAWHRDRIRFGAQARSGQTVATATAMCAVPADGLAPRINLWLYAGDGGPGSPPADGRDVELVIGAFTFASLT